MAIEEPTFETIEVREGYEIRRYAPYLVAHTVVDQSSGNAGGEAFRRLFGYISGRNRGPESSGSQKIAMTAPVITGATSGNADGAFYQFVMPASHTLDTLPVPDDPRVVLREVPARLVAVTRYSGRWTEANDREHEQALLRALERDGVVRRGEPVLARYDAPFTPWFVRRNEIMVEIER